MAKVTVIPEGFAIVSYRFNVTGDEENMYTTLGIKLEGTPDPNVLAENLWDNWSGNFGDAVMCTDTFFTGVQVRYGSSTGEGLVGEHSETEEGVVVGAPLPPNCAALITKNTALGGRRNRGRMYWFNGCVPESEVAMNGSWSGSVRTTIESALVNWPASLAGTAGVDFPVLFHSIDDEDPTPPSTTPTQVTSFTIAPRIATQRRRLRP